MAACNIFGYRCSDEVNIMIVSGAVKTIACELGMEKEATAEGIGNGLPSQATLTEMENTLAVDTRAKDCLEIVEDGEYNIGLLADHSNQKDQDHTVKLLTWAESDKEKNTTIKTAYLDIDMGRHSVEDAAAAVEISVHGLSNIVNAMRDSSRDKTECTAVIGGKGGGDAVQKV